MRTRRPTPTRVSPPNADGGETRRRREDPSVKATCSSRTPPTPAVTRVPFARPFRRNNNIAPSGKKKKKDNDNRKPTVFRDTRSRRALRPTVVRFFFFFLLCESLLSSHPITAIVQTTFVTFFTVKAPRPFASIRGVVERECDGTRVRSAF